MPRLNFEVTEQKMAELKALQQKAGSDTMKDLFNEAITTLEWLLEEVENGYEIASINENRDTYRVLVTPVLDRARKMVRRKAQDPILAPQP